MKSDTQENGDGATMYATNAIVSCFRK